MTVNTPKGISERFNAAINARDLTTLLSLMTEDHIFIDSGGDRIVGKAYNELNWKNFFKLYPNYFNIFEQTFEDGDRVAMRGYSECANEPVLSGPAIWTSVVRDGLVAEWRIYSDTLENRKKFGL